MRAGDLNRRLSVLRQTAGETDAFNERALGWPVFISVWCSRTDVSDAERTRAAGLGERLTTRFVIRNSSEAREISRRDRIRCDGQLYDIVAIKRVDRDLGLEITANAAEAAPAQP